MSDQSSSTDRPPAAPEAPARPAAPPALGTRFVTPEAVALDVDVAGPGSRMIAAFVDLAIQWAIITVTALVVFSGGNSGTAPLVVFLVLFVVILWGYYPVLEGLWNGQTIGKHVCHLRAVKNDGQPMTIGPVLVRNLIRIPEEFMFPFVAIVSMIVSTRSQRLGDLAAGTLVIRERALPAPVPYRAGPPDLGSRVDTSGIGDREYEVARSFLQRRASLTPDARVALAAQLATQLRPRVSSPAFPPGSDEAFLELFVASYQARFAAPGAGAGAAPPPIPPPPPPAGGSL
jgi:uncharacterized RDD family membrane protein YckC